MDETYLFSKTRYTRSHATMHSNAHSDEPHECPICVFQTLEIPTIPDAYNHAFSTNDPPDETLLASLRSSLASIRSVSAKIEKHLAAMQHAKNACALSIKKHEAAVHPIRSLPDDILLTIFRWCIHSKVRTRNGYSVPDLSLPWTFLYVSHRWRTLTLSSPLLWVAINIRQCYYRGRLPRLHDRLNFVIERSANCDLAVKIDDEDSDPPSLEESLQLLSRTTKRWGKLNIHAEYPILAPLAMCSFERLTELVWDFQCPGAPRTEFRNMVNLRRLTVLGSAPLDVRWDQITDYTCNSAGFQYLPKLTAMEHLALEAPFPSGPVLEAPLSLPRVRSMSVRERRGSSQAFYQIPLLLRFPSLNDLAISFEHGSALSSFPEPMGISVFLTRHDSIQSFHVENMYFLQLLRILPGLPIILPKLTRLSTWADALMFFPETFLEVVESRCGDDGGDVMHLVELEIMGTEEARAKAMSAISKDPALLERWNIVRGKIKIVEKGEYVWLRGKCY